MIRHASGDNHHCAEEERVSGDSGELQPVADIVYDMVKVDGTLDRLQELFEQLGVPDGETLGFEMVMPVIVASISSHTTLRLLDFGKGYWGGRAAM
jgi:hypothetical protein